MYDYTCAHSGVSTCILPESCSSELLSFQVVGCLGQMEGMEKPKTRGTREG